MIKSVFQCVVMVVFVSLRGTQINHHLLPDAEKKKKSIIWQKTHLEPFNELIISWDAQRPPTGGYLIEVSLLVNNTWSDWLKYAWWGATDQYTFKDQRSETAQAAYAATTTLNGQLATGFKTKVTAQDESSLLLFRALHTSTTNTRSHTIKPDYEPTAFIHLPVQGLSQMALETKDKERICSPTSTTAVIHYFAPSKDVNPVAFSQKVFDITRAIYGNWILNTAQAAHELGERWHCYIARLNSFNQVLQQLKKGYPVVVSIVGPITGGALSYEHGHLLVIKGYNPTTKEILCMDPAFLSDKETEVVYNLDDFMNAWQKRMGLAYMFYRS